MAFTKCTWFFFYQGWRAMEGPGSGLMNCSTWSSAPHIVATWQPIWPSLARLPSSLDSCDHGHPWGHGGSTLVGFPEAYTRYCFIWQTLPSCFIALTPLLLSACRLRASGLLRSLRWSKRQSMMTKMNVVHRGISRTIGASSPHLWTARGLRHARFISRVGILCLRFRTFRT